MIKKDIRATICLILAALICCLCLGHIFSRPETFQAIYNSIDSKTENVLTLTGASAIASTAISCIPDDIGTPIANQIAELMDYLMIILSILLAEKYLLAIAGMVTFRFLIPLAFLVWIPAISRRNRAIPVVLTKIAAVCLAFFLVIPASMGISDMIGKTYDLSIEEAITSVDDLSLAAEKAESDSLWSKVTDTVASVAHLPQKASKVVNQFVQAIAVMIVTSCIIPLLVLVLFLWIVKLTTGVSVRITQPHNRRLPHREREPQLEEV